MAKRVGLLLMVDLPELGGLHAVLQVRGTFNPEKMAPESYPGGCQVTCAGKIEPGERPDESLAREVQEELGIDLWGDTTPVCVDVGGDEMQVMVAHPPAEVLRKVRLHPGTGGLRLIQNGMPIRSLKIFGKVRGVRDRDVVAMFREEAEAVQEAFRIFKT